MGPVDRRAALLLVGAAAVLALAPRRAAGALEPLAAPAGRPVLWVKGLIDVTNGDDGMALFDRAMLEALPQGAIRTAVSWMDGEHEFSGPRLMALLDRLGARGTAIRVTALDSYTVEIPVDDLLANEPILALAKDGTPLRVRDRGPLCIIYPWSEKPDLRTDWGVWYVATIAVL